MTYRYFFGRARHTPGSVQSEGWMTILGVTTVMDGGRDFKICAIGSINSYYFPYKEDGYQPNSRGLYTYYKDSLLKVG